VTSPLPNGRGGVSTLVGPRSRSCNEPPEILRRIQEEVIVVFVFTEDNISNSHILVFKPSEEYPVFDHYLNPNPFRALLRGDLEEEFDD